MDGNLFYLLEGKLDDPAILWAILSSEFEVSSELGKSQLWREFHSLTLSKCRGEFAVFASEIARISSALGSLGDGPSDQGKLARLLVGLGEDQRFSSLRGAQWW